MLRSDDTWGTCGARGSRAAPSLAKNPTELGGARRVWAAMWKKSLAKKPTDLGGTRRVWAVMCSHRLATCRTSEFLETTAGKQGARCWKRTAWPVPR